jgi:uncharacterized protein YkwD
VSPAPTGIAGSPAHVARPWRRLTGALAAVLLAASALLIPATSAAAAPADDIYALVNQARAANGQGSLARNGSLDQVAAAWANQLAASGVLAHNPSYSTQIPAGWSRAGENVARGQVDGAQMHSEWMASPGHRANILGDYTDVGVAFLAAGGTTWGVQVFANYPAPVVAAPAAPAPVAAPADELETFALPTEDPVVDAAAKLTSVEAGPFRDASLPVAAVDARDWSWIALALGILLVAGAGIRSAVGRR